MSRKQLPNADRGYDYAHVKARRRMAIIVAGEGYICTRCHRYSPPGSEFHLDHNDDRSGYLGASHPFCNEQAAGRKARARDRIKLIRSRNW